MASKRISILALAKELGKSPYEIVRHCRTELCIPLPDVTEGKRGIKGYVGVGAAETIRELCLSGAIADPPTVTPREAEDWLVERLLRSVWSPCHEAIDILHCMAKWIKQQDIDPLSQRGLRLIRKALVLQYKFQGFDFWECESCGKHCRPTISAKFVAAFADAQLRRKSQVKDAKPRRKRKFKLSDCAACGGFPGPKVEG